MRRDSIFIFGFSILITMGIVGGAYYMSVLRPTHPQPAPVESPAPTGDSGVAWTDKPIKCLDEEVGEFWTNAKDCESANLKNRLSIAQPLQKTDHISPGANKTQKNLKATTTRADNKPSLRRVAKNVPSDLSVSCKFAAGKALEIERSLSAADNPSESVWRENYCRWVKETRTEGCGIARDFFYYGYLCGYGP